jgi:hypothetical protein
VVVRKVALFGLHYTAGKDGIVRVFLIMNLRLVFFLDRGPPLAQSSLETYLET